MTEEEVKRMAHERAVHEQRLLASQAGLIAPRGAAKAMMDAQAQDTSASPSATIPELVAMSAQQRARLDQLLSEIIEFGNEVKGIPRTGQINPGDQPEPLPSAPLDQAAFHLRESESVIGGCERVLRAVRSELFGRDDISGI